MKYRTLRKVAKKAAPYALAISHIALVAGTIALCGQPYEKVKLAAEITAPIGGLEGLFLRKILK